MRKYTANPLLSDADPNDNWTVNGAANAAVAQNDLTKLSAGTVTSDDGNIKGVSVDSLDPLAIASTNSTIGLVGGAYYSPAPNSEGFIYVDDVSGVTGAAAGERVALVEGLGTGTNAISADSRGYSEDSMSAGAAGVVPVTWDWDVATTPVSPNIGQYALAGTSSDLHTPSTIGSNLGRNQTTALIPDSWPALEVPYTDPTASTANRASTPVSYLQQVIADYTRATLSAVTAATVSAGLKLTPSATVGTGFKAGQLLSISKSSYASTTTGASSQASSVTTLTVTSTTGFPSTGVINVATGTAGQLLQYSYTGTTATTFTGLTRVNGLSTWTINAGSSVTEVSGATVGLITAVDPSTGVITVGTDNTDQGGNPGVGATRDIIAYSPKIASSATTTTTAASLTTSATITVSSVAGIAVGMVAYLKNWLRIGTVQSINTGTKVITIAGGAVNNYVASGATVSFYDFDEGFELRGPKGNTIACSLTGAPTVYSYTGASGGSDASYLSLIFKMKSVTTPVAMITQGIGAGTTGVTVYLSDVSRISVGDRLAFRSEIWKVTAVSASAKTVTVNNIFSTSAGTRTVATSAYANGDSQNNVIAFYANGDTTGDSNIIPIGATLTPLSWSPTGPGVVTVSYGSTFSFTFNASESPIAYPHAAGTAVYVWKPGARWLGTTTNGDLESFSIKTDGHGFGPQVVGTLFDDVNAGDTAVTVNGGLSYANPAKLTTPTSPDFSTDAWVRTVTVGTGLTAETVLLNGSFYQLNGSDFYTTQDGGPTGWYLADGWAFSNPHYAGEPVTTQSIRSTSTLSNAHAKDTPLCGGADNGTVATNGYQTAGALVASNPAGSGAVTLNTSLAFNEPWLASGENGTPNISAPLTYGALAGGSTIIVDNNNGWVSSFPAVYGSAGSLLPPQVGLVSGAASVGAAYVNVNFTSDYATDSAATTYIINGTPVTFSSAVTSTSTNHTTTLFVDTTVHTTGMPVAAADNTPLHLTTLNTSSVYRTLDVPTFQLTTSLTKNSSYTSLSVSPLPVAIASGTALTLRFGPLTQTVTTSANAAAGAISVSVNSFKSSYSFNASVGSNGEWTTTNTVVTVGLSAQLQYGARVMLQETSGSVTYSEVATVNRYCPTTASSVTIDPYTPDFAFTTAASLVYLLPMTIDHADALETVYPVSIPVGTELDDGIPVGPYSIDLADPLVNDHDAGAVLNYYRMPDGAIKGDVTYRPDLEEFLMYDGLGHWREARCAGVQGVFNILGSKTVRSVKDTEVFSLFDPISGKSTGGYTVKDAVSSNFTVHAGPLYSKDPSDKEWKYDTLSNVQLKIAVTVPQTGQVALRTTGLQMSFTAAPMVKSVYLSPSDMLDFSYPDNSVQWLYDDIDGDEQTWWEVKVYDDFTHQSDGFSPDSDPKAYPMTWYRKKNDNSTSALLDNGHDYNQEGSGLVTTKGFDDGQRYWAYVRVGKNFQGQTLWSGWESHYFIAIVNQPLQPLVAVLGDSGNATNTVLIQSSDNLLGVDNGSFSTGLGGWRASPAGRNTGVTASSISLGTTSIALTSALSGRGGYGDYISNILVGATGYLSVALSATVSAPLAATTLKISGTNGSNSNALGFPMKGGEFWVTIYAEGANTTEYVLLKPTTPAATGSADTFTISKRAYSPVINGSTVSAAASAHGQWAKIEYGLQKDVYSGSQGVIHYGYQTGGEKKTKTVMEPRWKSGTLPFTADPLSGGFSVAVDNSKMREGKDHLYIDDPSGAFDSKIGTTLKGQLAKVHYSTWKTTAVSIGAGSTVSTKSVSSVSDEVEQATIAAVHKAPLIQAPIVIGQLAGDHIGGKVTGGTKVKYMERLFIEISTAGLSAAVFQKAANGDGLGTNTFPAGSLFAIEGKPPKVDGSGNVTPDTSKPNVSIYVVLTKPWNSAAPGYYDSKRTKNFVYFLPIKPVGVAKPFAVPGTDSWYIPMRSNIIWCPPYQKTTRKKLIFTKPLGQGKFAGQSVHVGDTVMVDVVRSSAAPSGSYVQTPVSKTYTTPVNTFNFSQNFTVAPLSSAGDIVIPEATITTTTGSYSSMRISVAAATGVSVTTGSYTATAPKSSFANYYVGMTVDGVFGAGVEATITSITPNLADTAKVDVTFDKASTSTSTTATVSPAGLSGDYNGWGVSGDGIPDGVYVTTNTGWAGGASNYFTINLSASVTNPVDLGVFASAPTLNWSGTLTGVTLTPPATFVIPAGSMAVPTAPFSPNFAYPAHTQVEIKVPALFGDNAATVRPTNNGTAEVSVAPASITLNTPAPAYPGMTLVNSTPVETGVTYAFSAWSRVVKQAFGLRATYPKFTLFIDWVDDHGNLLSTTSGAAIGSHSVDGGYELGKYVSDWAVDPTYRWGNNWSPNAVLGTAPTVTVAAGATFSAGATAGTGTFTVPALANPLNPGTVLTASDGSTYTVTTTAARSATSVAVRYTAGMSVPSPTNLSIAATRACPRVQWRNAVTTDVYGLCGVSLKAVNVTGSGSWTTLSQSLDTLASASSPDTTSGSALVLSDPDTPTLGAASLYVLDPYAAATSAIALAYGTRETHLGGSTSLVWSSLASAVSAGDSSVTFTTLSGIAAGMSLVVGYGTAKAETVTVASTWTGSSVVPLTQPLVYSHSKKARVYGKTASLGTELSQAQAAGTQVAVLNWNVEGYVNPNDTKSTLTVNVERSDDGGSTWSLLMGGRNLALSQGRASVVDYEVIPNNALTRYRVTPTFTTPDPRSSTKFHSVTGISTGSLVAPTLSATSWWIASTSDSSLRYAINVRDGVQETQRHPSGTFYPLGSPYPITTPGVVTGRDAQMTVVWTDDSSWDDFLSFLKRGEVYVLTDPVEAKRRYIFINNDVSITHHAATSGPWREVQISFVEVPRPDYTFRN